VLEMRSEDGRIHEEWRTEKIVWPLPSHTFSNHVHKASLIYDMSNSVEEIETIVGGSHSKRRRKAFEVLCLCLCPSPCPSLLPLRKNSAQNLNNYLPPAHLAHDGVRNFP
jgi:hypothetical protein